MATGSFAWRSKTPVAGLILTSCREFSTPSSRRDERNWVVSDWDWRLAKRWLKRIAVQSTPKVRAAIKERSSPLDFQHACRLQFRNRPTPRVRLRNADLSAFCLLRITKIRIDL